MHIKKATVMAVLTFIGIHLAEAYRPKFFESKEHNANSTALLDCMTTIEEKLSEDHDRDFGLKCGNKYWEVGNTAEHSTFHQKWSAYETYDRCKKPVLEAAKKGADWYKCALRSTLHEGVVAWSPLGMRAGYKKDEPVKDEGIKK